MLISVRLRGGGVSIDLPVRDLTGEAPYILKSADGLGPPEMDVSISRSLNFGGVFQGRIPQSREPVFLITVNPNYTGPEKASVEKLRNDVYLLIDSWYSDPGLVLLDIFTDEKAPMMTNGYIKKVEITPFNKEPELQITMACPSPYLEQDNRVELNGLTYPNLEPAQVTIPKQGSAPAGVNLEIHINKNFPNGWGLSWFVGGRQTLTFFNYPFLVGDVISINTTTRIVNGVDEKQAYLTRGTQWIPLLSYLSPKSVWPYLTGGNMYFGSSPAPVALNEWSMDVVYYPQEWGI